MKIGALFAGYGGLDLATSMVLDAHPAWFVEYDAAPSKVLAHHWPEVPNYGDVTAVDWSAIEPVDVLTGGFPCQDVSTAGLRRGLKPGTRSGLWSHFALAIDAIRPPLVIIENVRGLLSAEAHSDVEPDPWDLGRSERDGGPTLRALGAVLGDLADLGYDAEWQGVRAADAGAPHGRFRVFIIAFPRDLGSLAAALERAGVQRTRGGLRPGGPGIAGDPARAITHAADAARERCASEPDLEGPDLAHASRLAPADAGGDLDQPAGPRRSGGVAGLESGSSGEGPRDGAGDPADRDPEPGDPDAPAVAGGTPADAPDGGLAGREDESGRQSDTDGGPLRVSGVGGEADRSGTAGALPDAGRLDGRSRPALTRSPRSGRAAGEYQRPSAAPADAARERDGGAGGDASGRAPGEEASGRDLRAPADAERLGRELRRGSGGLDGAQGSPAVLDRGTDGDPSRDRGPAPADADDRGGDGGRGARDRRREPADHDRDALRGRGRGAGTDLEPEAWGSDPRPPADAADLGPQRDEDAGRREPLPGGSAPRVPGTGGDALRTPAGAGGPDRGTPADADQRARDGRTDLALRSEEGRTAPQRDSGAGRLDWGAYEPAVRRWERILGRVAPAPTEVTANGAQRLAPRFVEWMMGLPVGHVTAPEVGLTRNEQLKALGNGVCPQQAALALEILLERVLDRLAA